MGFHFVNDTGRNFSFYKQLKSKDGTDGSLFIGIKLDFKNEPILFSEFKNIYRGEFTGMDVSGVNFEDENSLERCINISLQKLKKENILN